MKIHKNVSPMPRSPMVLNRINCIQLFSVLAVCIAIAMGLNACMVVGPDFVEPVEDVSDAWVQSLEGGLDSAAGPEAEWWMVFDDPVLNKLVELAKQGNNNLQVAGLRVLEAKAQLGIATGAQYPQDRFCRAMQLTFPLLILINLRRTAGRMGPVPM